MAKYRKVDPRIWTDIKFRSLSRDSRYFFLYLLTSPHSTAWGAYVLNDLYIQADLEYTPKQIKECWKECVQRNLVLRCETTFLICFKNWFKFNPPTNKKSSMACVRGIMSLQKCETLSRYCKESCFLKEQVANGSLTMFEQVEDEQEQEQEQEHGKPDNEKDIEEHLENGNGILKFKKEMPIPSYFHLTDEMRKYAAEKNINLDLEEFTEDMILSCQAKGYKYKNWYAVWQKWITKEWKRKKPIIQNPNISKHVPECNKEYTNDPC